MTDDDVRLLRTRLALLQRRLRRESHGVDELTRSAAVVLGAIDRLPAPTPRAVATDVHMTSSNVAAALRELDDAGLVARRPDPDDARRTRLEPTAAGRAAIGRTRAERDTWLGRAVHSMLDESERDTLREASVLLARLATYEGGTE